MTTVKTSPQPTALGSCRLGLFMALIFLRIFVLPAIAQETDIVETAAPVVVDGETVFSVRGGSAHPAERRASEIAIRVEDAAANSAVTPQSVSLMESEDATRIIAGGKTIMTVVDADGLREGVRRTVAAHAFQQRIMEAIE